jgi:ubiquinone/menaquinone biosynthesis C-methylase UbiE
VSGSYYQQVAEAFDGAAQGYDALYQTNVVMAWMRQESLALLQGVFPLGSHLLELGCGTGEEALALHRLGYHVVAIDVSPQMIATARAKATAAGAEGIDWRVLSAGLLPQLVAEFGAGAFDGAYSSFGALNCEAHLQPIAAALARLLPTGAQVVCSVMNRWCIWEIAWFALHGQPRAALRRLRKGWVAAGLASRDAGLTVPVLYYSPRQFARVFSPYFAAEQELGLPVLWPPPYLEHLVRGHGSLFTCLEKMERRVRGRLPFSAWGDHFALCLRRL